MGPSTAGIQDFLRLSRRELAVVVAVGLALIVGVVSVPVGSHALIARVGGVACALIEAGALLFMRRAPVGAMAIALAAGAALQALFSFVGAWGGATIALYILARIRSPRMSAWALLAMIVLAPWNGLAGSWPRAVVAGVAALVAWGLGARARTRELGRQRQVREAVAEERRRIARELHDVISHNVAVMVVQATAAEDQFQARPEQAGDALAAIASAGRAALSDLRQMLAVISHEEEESVHAPSPGLDDLDRLAAAVRAAGLSVSLEIDGDRPHVPAGVGLVVYRIAQEALTNTLRHAQASHASVVVRCHPDVVELDVRDDGRAGVSLALGEGGRGIIGMRERAALLGGAVEAGGQPDGGFRVRARLPLADAR